MGFKKNNPGCGCCDDAACLSFGDTFSRANSTNLGSNWTEVSGDWSIASNQLSVSSSNAVVLLTQTGDNGGEVVVTLRCLLPDDNDQLVVILDYQDEDNFHYALATRGSPSNVKLFIRSGGTDTELVSALLSFGKNVLGFDRQFEFQVCLVDGIISAIVGNVEGGGISLSAGTVHAATTPFGSSKFGIGTGALNTTMLIDNYEAGDISAGCDVCDDCGGCNHTQAGNYQIDVSGGSTYMLSSEGQCAFQYAPVSSTRGYRLTLSDAPPSVRVIEVLRDHTGEPYVGSSYGWLKERGDSSCELVDFELGPSDTYGSNPHSYTLTINAL